LLVHAFNQQIHKIVVLFIQPTNDQTCAAVTGVPISACGILQFQMLQAGKHLCADGMQCQRGGGGGWVMKFEDKTLSSM